MNARALAIAFAALALALIGRAAAGKPRVAIVGKDAAVVAAVGKALAGKATIVEASAGADALITVDVERGKRKSTAVVVVRNGGDGAERGRLVVRDTKKKLARAVGKQVVRKLGPAIRSATAAAPPPTTAPPAVTAAPPAPVPVPLPVPETKAAAPAAEPEAPVRHTLAVAPSRPAQLRIAVDERPFWRRLRYNDDLDDVLRPYDLAANAVGVTVAARPAAAVPGLHVALAGEMTVGVNGSRTRDGTAYDTRASEWSAGVGWDVRLGRVRAGLSAAYGEQRFAIHDEAMTGARELVPDVTYRWARGGLDAERTMSPRWSLAARAGYRHLLSTGELDDAGWFPRATGAGLDGSLGANLHLGRRLTAYARAEVRHYFFAMHPEPGDELVAGGAVDQYLGGAIGLALSVN